MNVGSISALNFSTTQRPDTIEQAAENFETMLIAQLLKAAREAGQVLAQESEMTGAENYLEYAETHVAKVLAERGSLGFAALLAKDLANKG